MAVTWWPLAHAGVVYVRPRIDADEELTLAVSGRLWRDALIMFERETKSL